MTVPQASLKPKLRKSLMTLVLALVIKEGLVSDESSAKGIIALALSSKRALMTFEGLVKKFFMTYYDAPSNSNTTQSKKYFEIRQDDNSFGRHLYLNFEPLFCRFCLHFVDECRIGGPLSDLSFFRSMNNLRKLLVENDFNLQSIPPQIQNLTVHNCINIDTFLSHLHTFLSVKSLTFDVYNLKDLLTVAHNVARVRSIWITTTFYPIQLSGTPRDELNIMNTFMSRFLRLKEISWDVHMLADLRCIGSLSPQEVIRMVYNYFSVFRRIFETTEFNARVWTTIYVTNWLTITREVYEDAERTFEAAGYQCTEAVFRHRLLLSDKALLHTMNITFTN